MLAMFTKPSKIDQAPFKTIWQFIHSDKSHEYYIQLSEDESKPNWKRLGLLYEEAFEWHILNDQKSFIEDIMRLMERRLVKVEEPEN